MNNHNDFRNFLSFLDKELFLPEAQRIAYLKIKENEKSFKLNKNEYIQLVLERCAQLIENNVTFEKAIEEEFFGESLIKLGKNIGNLPAIMQDLLTEHTADLSDDIVEFLKEYKKLGDFFRIKAEEANIAMSAYGEILTTLEAKQQEYQTLLDEIAAEKANLEEIEAEINSSEYKELKKEYDKLLIEVPKTREQLTKLKDEMSELEFKRSSMQGEVKDFQLKIDILNKLIAEVNMRGNYGRS